jgi:hypothetical protein
MNSEMIKSKMVVLTRRENVNVAYADVDVGWILYAATSTGQERESWCCVVEIKIETAYESN